MILTAILLVIINCKGSKVYIDYAKGSIIQERNDALLITKLTTINVEVLHKFPTFKSMGTCDFNNLILKMKSVNPKQLERNRTTSRHDITLLRKINTKPKKFQTSLQERFAEILNNQYLFEDITDLIRQLVSLCFNPSVHCNFLVHLYPKYCINKAHNSVANDCGYRGSVCCKQDRFDANCPLNAWNELTQY